MNLFIDTSSNIVTLASFENEIEKKVVYKSKNDITTTIYEKLDQIINPSDYSTLEKIYVVVGPGSFTGVRIGVIIAKTLSMELGIKIYPINVLNLYNKCYDKKIALDARGKKYFTYDGIEYKIVKEDELNNYEYLIDPEIDIDLIIEKDILKTYKEKKYNEVTVEYLKDVI